MTSRRVVYKLPPRLRVVPNPHYNSGGDTDYAPYTLESLGAYPTGNYFINLNNAFGGTYLVTSTTETTITVVYQTRPGTYPAKESEPFMDILDYTFAFEPYANNPNVGMSNEKMYDPEIFDFNANSTGIVRLNKTVDVQWQRGYVVNPDKTLANFILEPGDVIPNGILTRYGYAMISIPDLPGFDTETTTDPTGLDIIPQSLLKSAKGRYLVLINTIEGYSNTINYDIYPSFPNDRNVSITTTNLVSSVGGLTISIDYDSLYKADTGIGHGYIYPYKKSLTSNFQPIRIYLPTGSDMGDMRFYDRVPGEEYVPFDFNTGAKPPIGELFPNRAVPANFLRFI